MKTKIRHARESGHPGSIPMCVQKGWIPVFTGMTEGNVDSESTLLEPLGFESRVVQ